MERLEESNVYETVVRGNLVRGQMFETEQRGKQVLRSPNARLFIGGKIGVTTISRHPEGILETFYGRDGTVIDIALHRTNYSSYAKQEAFIGAAEKWEEAT